MRATGGQRPPRSPAVIGCVIERHFTFGLVLGTAERLPTQLFDGDAEYVADLYRGRDRERLFA
jgi:hypothetical protein